MRACGRWMRVCENASDGSVEGKRRGGMVVVQDPILQLRCVQTCAAPLHLLPAPGATSCPAWRCRCRCLPSLLALPARGLACVSKIQPLPSNTHTHTCSDSDKGASQCVELNYSCSNYCKASPWFVAWDALMDCGAHACIHACMPSFPASPPRSNAPLVTAAERHPDGAPRLLRPGCG